MKNIKNFKIKNKLIAIILLITSLIMIIAFASITVWEHKNSIESLRREITYSTEITAKNLTAVLAFSSIEQMEGELSVLKGNRDIKNCYVYDEAEEFLVNYDQPGGEKIHPPAIKNSKERSITTIGNYIHVSQPIIQKGEYFGRLYVRVSTSKVDKKINELMLFLVFLICVLIVLSIFLANKMQAIISKPILNLVAVTKKVSLEGNYALRVQKQNTDEIGMLYDEFNEMMEQLLKRNIERDRVEGKLKNAQLFLSSVIDSMPSLLIAIEQNGTVTKWNKSAVNITGISAVLAKGKNFWKLFPDFNQFKEPIDNILKTGKPVEFYKKLVKTKEKTFYFNGFIFPLFDTSELKFIIMLNNVTETEIKEQQLRQSQKMETVGNLAGGLAHDFNNVLGGIIGTISLFRYKTVKNKEVTAAETEKYFSTIETSANRASDMVKHLLSLTRKHELFFSPTDLNSTVQHIIKICKNTFDKSVEINTEYFHQKALANADATQIEQCLLNLCLNASHAMTIMRADVEKYGGQLSVAINKLIVDKFFRQLHPDATEPEYWDISVSDTGVGISPKVLTNIFDPFFTTKRKGTGTGLGLSMVYNITKQHNGFLKVYSQEEIGTTFHIYLPILKGQISATSKHTVETLHKGKGTVLVVDDEEVMRFTTQSILHECGYETMAANNGAEGVEVYRNNKEKIDAILLDMVMPKMSGKQAFLELIKMDKDVKVLLTSGFKQDERVESILKLGVKAFLQKPFTLLDLANTLYRILQGEEE
ncbi:MAG: response regulator [bacterium]|nr:response regulator [bacterium]